MAKYPKHGPFQNGTAPGIDQTFLNDVETYLSYAADSNITSDGNGNMIFTIGGIRRGAGYQEKGKYYLQGGANAGGWIVSQYMQTISRGATPASVTIDTADQAPTASAGTPATGNLSSNGFQVFFAATAVSNTARAGGNWTCSY